jgi:hypothetical protein
MVARPNGAEIAHVEDHLNALILGCESPQNVLGAIRGRIVDNDYFVLVLG